ncbi:MAG: DUF1566 domain-containing protein [Rhodanobacteraceae bacterium]|nr:DUF1566 domain-containing protein [Rhodanobacteraceae bacterium]
MRSGYQQRSYQRPVPDKPNHRIVVGTILGLALLLDSFVATQAADSQGGKALAGLTDFVKVGNNGSLLASGAVLGPGATDWACTRQVSTRLTWEVKLPAAGVLRSASNTYSWRDSDNSRNGGTPGLANGGSCSGSACDTQAFVAAVNATQLCGYSDWRLPSKSELQGIVVQSGQGTGTAVTPGSYFPSVSASAYWTGINLAPNPAMAWVVAMDLGNGIYRNKATPLRVMLVRGGQ